MVIQIAEKFVDVNFEAGLLQQVLQDDLVVENFPIREFPDFTPELLFKGFNWNKIQDFVFYFS